MKGLLAVMAIFLAVALSGCATPYDVDLQREHKEDKVSHNQETTKRVVAKANAIKEVMVADCQDDTAACGMARAFAGAFAAREIASIKADSYEGKAPTLGTDVQVRGLETVEKGIPFATVTVVSHKAIDKDKGVVNQNADNGGTVSNNYDEDHATSVSTEEGDSTANNSPSGNSEEVVFTPDEE